MKLHKNPDPKGLDLILQRPVVEEQQLSDLVRPIYEAVKKEGDAAIRRYNKSFDSNNSSEITLDEKEIELAVRLIDSDLAKAIKSAAANIEKFHRAQQSQTTVVETTPGVFCWQKQVPIGKVGLYIPSGTAPLFSTVLMLGIPATIAGCDEIILCTPAKENVVNPEILFAASLVGIKKIYKVGGAQAIAAMAFGTETIPKVSKIFGPGNQFVTRAKLFAQLNGVAIDLPAGPSEVLIIADESADPNFIAADLISQAEHGTDSQVVLISPSEKIIQSVRRRIKEQLKDLPRAEIARAAIANSKAILVSTLDEAMEISNKYAPEHLILNTENADRLSTKVINAGSVFLGQYTPESAGDYASGTNHTLPTNGFAAAYSGVNLQSFMKSITFQSIDKDGLLELGPVVEAMAKAEGLEGHRRAVSLRLQKLQIES